MKTKNQTDRADWTDLPPARQMSHADILAHAPQIVAAGFRRGLLSLKPAGAPLAECAHLAPMPSAVEIAKRTKEDDAICKAWEISRPQMDDYPNTARGRQQYRKEYQAWCCKRLRAREKAAAGGKIPDRRFFTDREVAK